MSYTKVKSLSFNKNGVRLSGASSNVFPITYHSYDIKPKEGESMEDLIRSIFSLLEDREYQINPGNKNNSHYAFLLTELLERYLYDSLSEFNTDDVDMYYFKNLKKTMEENRVDFENFKDYMDFIIDKDREFVYNEEGVATNISWLFVRFIDVLKGSEGSMQKAKAIADIGTIKSDFFLFLVSSNILSNLNNKIYQVKKSGYDVSLNMNGRYTYQEKKMSIKDILNIHAKFSILFDPEYTIHDEHGNQLEIIDLLNMVEVERFIDEFEDIKLILEQPAPENTHRYIRHLERLLYNSKLEEAREFVENKF